jgi:hypothetical protein
MLRVNLGNRVNNTFLPKSAGLLPVEAIVNSIQALEDAGQPSDGRVEISPIRETSLDVERDLKERAPIVSFRIEDNGIGFTDANYESFLTSDSDYKAQRGGKGVGRLLWLKAFDHVEIDSVFEQDGFKQRVFRFARDSDLADDPIAESIEPQRRTVVTLSQVFNDFAASIPRDLDRIAQRIVEHCLPFFMATYVPKITLQEAGHTIDLNLYFDRYCADRSTKQDFDVGGFQFTLTGFRLFDTQVHDHALVFTAHGREVVTDRLHRYIPNLRARLSDGQSGSFTYLGYIRGSYLDSNVNVERTGFTFGDRRSTDGSLNVQTCLEDISGAAVALVEQELKPQLDSLDQEKAETVTRYVEDKAPQYRILLSENGRVDTLKRITPGLDERHLESALHGILHEKTVEARAAMENAISKSPEGISPDEYLASIKTAIGAYNEVGKSKLADYVSHRKVIIDFLERALKRDEESKSYSLEEVIHNLIFPMRTTSDDVNFDDHNLWLIDERLAYHVYLTSDKSLRSAKRLSNDSKKRADLLVFDRALAYSEGEKPVGAITLVEFKRPDRSDYRNDNPLSQVTDLLDELRAGHYKDERTGREVKLSADNVPAYVFIVCDMTAEIEKIAKLSLQRTPDQLGYFGFIKEHSAYVEIISYDKLLNDAQKRNRAFFDALGISSIKASPSEAEDIKRT